MRVAVAGATGVMGTQVVAALERADHEVVHVARSRGVDLTTGRGLDDALAGVEAVVDASNVQTLSRRKSLRFFEAATSRLLEAEARASVRHHVVVSIVGIDRVDTGYYAGKLRQEELVRQGRVPFTILRATQFHEFAQQVLDRSPGPVALVPRMRVQTVAASEVGAEVARLATGDPSRSVLEMGGPEVHDLGELVRRVASRAARPRRVVDLPVPGNAGRAMAGGALLPGGGATLGRITFEEWLSRAGHSGP